MTRSTRTATVALSACCALAVACGAFCAMPTRACAAELTSQAMYRLYNPNSGEHFYTGSAAEANATSAAGWTYEGEGWTAPTKSNSPVFRLYNANAGDHHYTLSAFERDSLVAIGWNYEGIGWYSDDSKTVPLYRQYNPNAVAGAHNYTTSKAENDMLVGVGWQAEGIGWYGLPSGWALMDLANQERAKPEISADPLEWNYQLQATAELRARELATKFSHTRPDGTQCFTAWPSSLSGYANAENIAYGYTSSITAHKGWVNSPGHYANMTSTNFKSMAAASYSTPYGTYWVECFTGAPGN